MLGGLNKPLVNKTGKRFLSVTGENIVGTIGISIVTVTCNDGTHGFTTWLCGRGKAIKLCGNDNVDSFFSCSMDGDTLKVISTFGTSAFTEVCTILLEYY